MLRHTQQSQNEEHAVGSAVPGTRSQRSPKLKIDCDSIPKHTHYHIHLEGEGVNAAPLRVRVEVLPKYSRKPMYDEEFVIPASEEGADETQRTEQLDYPKIQIDGENCPIIDADGYRCLAVTLRVTVRLEVPEGGGLRLRSQTSWDKELRHIPAEYTQELERSANRLFQAKKQKTWNVIGLLGGGPSQDMKAALFGQQHHGKSSTINSLNRFMKADMTKPDVAQTAPASRSATTTLLNYIKLTPFFTVFDLPHVENIAEDKRTLVHLLVHGAADKTQKLEWMQGKHPNGRPDFVILVVSFTAWLGGWETTAEWLHEMQKIFHEESLQNYPYCVAVTHYDEFLKNCQKDNPWYEMQTVLRNIQSHANTTSVFAIANFKTHGAVFEESAASIKDMIRQAAAFRAIMEGDDPAEWGHTTHLHQQQ